MADITLARLILKQAKLTILKDPVFGDMELDWINTDTNQIVATGYIGHTHTSVTVIYPDSKHIRYTGSEAHELRLTYKEIHFEYNS